MSDTDKTHGPALRRYLDNLRGTVTMRQFALSIGYDYQRIHQWNGHREPSIEHMRELADALGRPLGEVLVGAEYGTPDDFGGVLPPPPELPIREAIQRATDVDDAYKTNLFTMMDLLNSGRSVEAEPVKASGRKRRTGA
jgi:hypothetical protein